MADLLDHVHNGLTQDDWRRLCMRAFENLRTDTTITMDEVDAILTWCLPAYGEHLAAAGRLLPEGAQVEIIYGSRDRNGLVQSTGPGPIGLANARASLHPVFVELVVQERRLWPDGTRFSSPWRTFQDQGSTDE